MDSIEDRLKIVEEQMKIMSRFIRMLIQINSGVPMNKTEDYQWLLDNDQIFEAKQ